MKNAKHLGLWANGETHARFSALARDRDMSVACLLGELVDEALDEAGEVSVAAVETREPRRGYLTIRLRPGDLKVITQRAAIRRMKAATYVAALVRAHLVVDPPLPSKEFAALERLTAELSAVGRNLNQVTRAINSGLPVPAGTAALIGRSIELVETVREATKVYLRAASASWDAPLG